MYYNSLQKNVDMKMIASKLKHLNSLLNVNLIVRHNTTYGYSVYVDSPANNPLVTGTKAEILLFLAGMQTSLEIGEKYRFPS